MANKQQLQTNNTKYASLIETLRGKAAGGGSGGGSVKTCTLYLDISTCTENVQFVYSDVNGACVYYEHDSNWFQGDITLNKGLFIVMYDLESPTFDYMTLTGGVEFVQQIPSGGHGAIFKITGDGSITT